MQQLGIAERFISVDEACEYLNIKKSWLYQNHKSENMPSYKMNRKLVFRTSDLDSWMLSNFANN